MNKVWGDLSIFIVSAFTPVINKSLKASPFSPQSLHFGYKAKDGESPHPSLSPSRGLASAMHRREADGPSFQAQGLLLSLSFKLCRPTLS